MASYEIPNASDGSVIEDLILDNEDSLSVWAGGSALNTTVNEGGRMTVNSGGWAGSTTLTYYGFLEVLRGGRAYVVKITDYAVLDIVSGGVVSWLEFDSGANGWIRDEGTVSEVKISGAYVSGETARFVNTRLENGGRFTVSAGGVVNSITNSDSLLSMTEGTVLIDAMFTGRNASGALNGVSVYDMTVVESGAKVSLVGGIAEDVIVRKEASFNFSAGAVVNSLTLSGASALIDSGVLNAATITDSYDSDCNSTTSGRLALCGGEVGSATLSGLAYLVLESGYDTCVASDTVLVGAEKEKRPWFEVKSGCTANNTTVGGNCVMSIYEAAAQGIDVASGGSVLMCSQVDVSDLVCSEGGYMEFDVMSGASITGTSAGTPFKVMDCKLTGLATLKNMTVRVRDGGRIDDVSIQSGARVIVNSGCSVGVTDPDSCTSVGVGGELIVSDYGSAVNVRECGGYVQAASNATVTFLPTDYFNNVVLTSNTSASLNAGTANSTTVSGVENVSNAAFYVMDAGVAYDTHVMHNGRFTVERGGTAVRTLIEGGGGCTVGPGGSVSETTVNADCGFMVNGVATDTTVNGGHLNVGDSGVASGGTVTGGYFNIYYGGSAYDIVLNGGGSGSASVNYGGTAVRTVVNSGAVLSASEGSYLSGTVVNNGGELRILSENATVAGTTVAKDGRLEIASGGTLKGDVTFADGGQMEFDLTGLYPGTHIMVDNLADITGNPDYRIAVAPATQAIGSYAIASGAAGFTGTMTVVDAELGTTLGTLSAGESLEIREGVFCSFAVKGGDLSLTVGDKPVPRDDGPDDGWNRDPYDKKAKTLDEAAVSEFIKNPLKAGVTEVLLDREGSVDVEGKNNFVGRGEDEEGAVLVDEYDFAQITLDHAAKMSFRLESTDKAEFTVYSLVETGTNGEGQKTYKRKALQTSTLKLDKATGLYRIDTAACKLPANDPDGTSGEYYICVQSPNAKKGGNAYYNVELNKENSTFYIDADGGLNGWLYDKKKDPEHCNGSLHANDVGAGSGPVRLEVVNTDIMINVDGENRTYHNFVGFGDEWDYAEIVVASAGTCTFTVNAYGTANSSSAFSVCSLTWNESKKVWTQKTLTTQAVKIAKKADHVDGVSTKEVNFKTATDAVTRYFVSMQSAGAKNGAELFYNVTAEFTPAGTGIADALAMPETSDSLAMTDALGFGRCDVDALADVSAASLAELDGISARQNAGLLA